VEIDIGWWYEQWAGIRKIVDGGQNVQAFSYKMNTF